MKISKPLHISVIHRCISYAGNHLFSVAGILPYNIISGEIKFEQDFWGTVSDVLETSALDSGVAKGRPEYLLNACFFSKNKEPIDAGWASVEIGKLKKKLAVFGPRYWLPDGSPSRSGTLTEQALLYSHAFGGEANALNPSGVGDVTQLDAIPDGVELPRVEYLDQLIIHAKDSPSPAAFNQVAIQSSSRLSRLGTVNEQNDPYAFPEDMDWTFFNDSAEDQWFNEPLSGEERYKFTHMHPEKPVIEGRIPDYRMRCFIKRKNTDLEKSDFGSSNVIEEISLSLDTLWFCPHKESGALVFHGATIVGNRFADEIDHLLMAFEGKNEKEKTLEHYKQAVKLREDPKDAYKYALYSKDLIPLDCASDIESLFNQDDEDGIQSFTEENIDCFMNKKTKDIKDDVDKKLDEAAVSIDQTLKKTSDQTQLLLLLEQMDERIDGLKKSGDAANGKFENQLMALIEKRKEIADSLDQLNGANQSLSNLTSEIKKGINNPVADPELEKLMAFVDKIAPKSETNPKRVDIAKVDFKAMDKLGEKIEQYVNVKLKEKIPEVQSMFQSLRENLKAMPKLLDEQSRPMDQVKQTIENLSIEKNQDVTNSLSGLNKMTDNAEELKSVINTLLANIDEQEKMTLAMLNGKKIKQKLFRPPKPAVFEAMENTLKQQMNNLRNEVIQLMKKLDIDTRSVCDNLKQESNEKSLQALRKELENSKKKLDIGQFLDVLDKLEESFAVIKQQKEHMQQTEPQLKDNYRMGAHEMDEGLYPHDDSIDERRDALINVLAKKTQNIMKDYPCIALSHVSGSDLDLSDNYFEQNNHDNCFFDRCDFSRAIAPRINLSDGKFEDSNFTQANLGRSVIKTSRFINCCFMETIFSHSLIQDTVFENCKFDKLQLINACFKNVQFRNCTISSCHFVELLLQDVQYLGSTFKKSSFIKCDTRKVELPKCQLQDVAFIDLNMSDSTFFACAMTNVTFMGITSLERTCFDEVIADNINFKDIALPSASMKKAKIKKALFAGANMSSCILDNAIIHEAIFIGTNLTKASLNDSSLTQANFCGARLINAKFNRSNLYQADFLDAVLGDTLFIAANLDDTILEQWRPVL